MPFNFSGVGFDSDVYITVNSGLHVGLFLAIIAPALVLCMVCAMAIVTTSDINWQMRVLLFNIFSVEVCNWLAFSVEFLGFPSRALNVDDTLYSCRIFLSLLITSTIQKYFAISFYSIMVYLFLKYGVKKLNLCVIISFVVVTCHGLSPLRVPPLFTLISLNSLIVEDSAVVLLT